MPRRYSLPRGRSFYDPREYLFAFPGGDIGTWFTDGGDPLDEAALFGITFAADTDHPGPSGHNLLVTTTDTDQSNYFCTPVFPVVAGSIIEWGLILEGVSGSVYLADYYPLYWTAAEAPVPGWGAGYGDYGESAVVRTDAGVGSWPRLGSKPTVFYAMDVIPAGVVQCSIEFICSNATAAEAFTFAVLGCFVRVTPSPPIS
jgi:hypothetical protein